MFFEHRRFGLLATMIMKSISCASFYFANYIKVAVAILIVAVGGVDFLDREP